MKKYLFILLLFSFRAEAVFTNNIACTFLAISNAVTTVTNEGDVIIVGPGICTISNQIVVAYGKDFSFFGSGTNQTFLNSGPITRCFYFTSPRGPSVMNIAHMTCSGLINNSFGFFSIEGAGPFFGGTNGPFHVYDMVFTNITFRALNVGANGSFGLIDHCSFYQQAGGPQPISFGGYGYKAWTNAIPFNSTNNIFVEDCYFKNVGGTGNGHFDAYDGAQLVWRHNFHDGYNASGVHGYDSQPTSARTWEIYANIFSNYAGGLVIELRGGTGYIYSNICYGASVFCNLAYYRSCASAHAGTVNTRGIPGQGYILTNFTSNPTNTQFSTINTYTSYSYLTSYAPNSNPTGPNGYGGGNVVIGATLADTMLNLVAAINQGPGSGTIYAPSQSVDNKTGFNHDFTAIGYTTNTVILTNALDGNTDIYGYPAAFQEGIIKSYPINASNFVNTPLLWPCYAWANTLDGVSQNFTYKDDTDPCNHMVTNLVMLGRDAFNGIVPTNYTAFTYPHPLQADEGNPIPPPPVPASGIFNIITTKIGGIIKLQ